MPTMRKQAYKIATGTLTVAAMASVDAITAWPIQSDQNSAFKWNTPYDANLAVPTYARYVSALDASISPDGNLQGAFIFDYWTNGMLSYALTTFFSSGVDYAAAATIQTYDDTDTVTVLNCTLFRPIAGRDMQAQIGGWQNITLRWTKASQAAAS